MNGQQPKPKNWVEWESYLKEAVKDVEIQLELLRAQLLEAESHVQAQ